MRIRAKIMKTPFVARLWIGLGQNTEKNTLFGRALVRVMAKIEKNTHFK